ncbi:hypothetical protein [Arthrobacter sp. K5]|uniref:Uncharacterized protein n=1 Tax=Arthrobacter sp. K5 TaxID=2839623 RepID=A0AAU8EX74_9MICC
MLEIRFRARAELKLPARFKRQTSCHIHVAQFGEQTPMVILWKRKLKGWVSDAAHKEFEFKADLFCGTGRKA